MGLLFHPTHINKQNQTDRRHGYEDLLRYPKLFPFHWRLWNGGTTRLLLWGDPEYVKRFVESARVYEGNSFEVNEMLATKMLGADHGSQPFDILNPEYQYYDYEFERYWYFYQVWGRIGYNPDTPTEVWEQEFCRRFGKTAGQVMMDGLYLASRVLPRIVAVSYPYKHFPTTRGWAEMQRQYDLPDCAKAEGSDVQQFMNIGDFAEMLLSGPVTPQRIPLHTSNWFRSVSQKILEKANEAEVEADAIKGNEFVSTITDLKILAYLAEYHAGRLLAGTQYNLYLTSENPVALDEAIKMEKEAREAWSFIVKAAGDVYIDQLIFGVHEVGFPRHWKYQLIELDRGLQELIEMQKSLGSRTGKEPILPSRNKGDLLAFFREGEKDLPEVFPERINQAIPGKNLTVHARVTDSSGIKWVRLRYRHLSQFEDFRTIEMLFDPASGLYTAVIPGDFIIPEWDLMYFIEAVDNSGNGCMIPDLEVEMPYIIVRTSD